MVLQSIRWRPDAFRMPFGRAFNQLDLNGSYDGVSKPVIPPRRHRGHRHRYNKIIHKERNIIERFFAKLKQFRRVATRYDKLLANLLGFVKIAAIALCIK